MYPTKNLGVLGDSGFVATSSKIIAERMRKLRYYADNQREYFDPKALHGRMDTVQAAFLSKILDYFPVLSHRREEIFELYNKNLPNQLQKLHYNEKMRIVPYEYPVQKHYSTMLHKLTEFGNLCELPNTVLFNNNILCLPVIPDDNYIEHTEEIINAIKYYFHGKQ
jgi:hypothetical protein